MPSPAKVQKLSVAQICVKDSPEKEHLSDPLLSLLPQELQRAALSFLLAPPVPVVNPKSLEDKQRPFQELADCHHSLSLVSKGWKRVVGDVVNAGSIGATGVSPRKLAELKGAVCGLNLSTSFIHKTFQSLLKTQWPDPFMIFFTVVPFFGGNDSRRDPEAMEVFTKIVQDEYKRFLVAKCVEVLMEERQRSDASMQGEGSRDDSSSRPNKLVEIFWQAHILSTRQYWADCHLLVNTVIPFPSPQLVSGVSKPSQRENESSSTNPSLQDLLFAFEKHFLKRNHFCVCSLPGTQHSQPLLTLHSLFAASSLHDLARTIAAWTDDERDVPCGLCHVSCCTYCCHFRGGFARRRIKKRRTLHGSGEVELAMVAE